jgi:DNA (cytosine-5)-methyltransferase 1
VAQRRRRVFVVGHLGDWHRAAAVLFERESLSGNSPPRRETRQGTAGTIKAGIGRCWNDNENNDNLIPEVAHAVTCHQVKGGDPTTDNYVTHSLRADGFDASEDGTGRGTPIVAFQSSQSGVRTVNTHATLDSNNGSRRHNGVITGMSVRRLTPRECERLQGFPDDYTLVPYRNKPAADGPRYKALGNSMAVPVMRWIGQRIQLVEQYLQRAQSPVSPPPSPSPAPSPDPQSANTPLSFSRPRARAAWTPRRCSPQPATS